MGYDSRVEGDIFIEPKVSHKLMDELMAKNFAQKPEDKYYKGGRELVVDYSKSKQLTDEGVLISYRGFAITCPWDGPHKAYTIIDDLKEIIFILGPGYTYKGFLQISGEEDGDLWRLRIKDGKVEEVHPTIVWPED